MKLCVRVCEGLYWWIYWVNGLVSYEGAWLWVRVFVCECVCMWMCELEGHWESKCEWLKNGGSECVSTIWMRENERERDREWMCVDVWLNKDVVGELISDVVGLVWLSYIPFGLLDRELLKLCHFRGWVGFGHAEILF